MAGWSELDVWWHRELSEDPAYRAEVRPLFRDLFDSAPGLVILDLGTGTGWVLEELSERDCIGIGVELNPHLARTAARHGSTVVGRLPQLSWCRTASLDGVTAVLVLEHIDDLETLFAETARVVRHGGTFTLVVNHPQITAPGAAPVVDPIDGEVYWRWGRYLEAGSTDEPAGDSTVTFHHRTMAGLLGAAADSGWVLGAISERGLPEHSADGDPLMELQRGLPRLLGVRWWRN